MKKGRVGENLTVYPVFKLIQQMNFDHNPKLTANRFFISHHDENYDIELLFKTAPYIYKRVLVELFSNMYSSVYSFEFNPKAPKGERVKITFEDNAIEGIQGLERLLNKIKQERDKYVQEQYYLRQ